MWVPSLPADSEERAAKVTSRIADKRASHYWDEKGELKKAYQKVMKMDEPAWDVYYVYDGEAEWKTQPPVPVSNMHQLNSLPSERMLDGDKLASEINELLAAKNDNK